MTLHSALSALQLHEAFHYVNSSDPGAVGAGKYWLDTTSEPYVLKRRNAGDDDWVTVGAEAAPAAAETLVFTYHVPGTLTTGAKPVRLLAPVACTIQNVTATVNTAPTGASLIIDIHKNGTTIFTTQGNRPTILASAQTDENSVPDVTALIQNDVLTLEIDQIGSTIAGADLNVQVRCVKA